MSIKMKIKVTKEILKKSMWCSTSAGIGDVVKNCAVALAVRDIFPRAEVGYDLIYTGTEVYRKHFLPLPREVTFFIKDFDLLKYAPEERLKLSELEFEIEIPDEVISNIGNGNIEEVKTIIRNSETLELV